VSRILIVARNTFREAVRDRVLYNLVFFALLMIASAVIVGQISMDIETIVMVSLGLSAISLIGLLIGRQEVAAERHLRAYRIEEVGIHA